jgi:hypothetical protein
MSHETSDSIDRWREEQIEENAKRLKEERIRREKADIKKNNLEQRIPKLVTILHSKVEGNFKHAPYLRKEAYKELKKIKKRFNSYHDALMGSDYALKEYEKQPLQRLKKYTKNAFKVGLVGLVLFGSCTQIRSCYNERQEIKAYEKKQEKERADAHFKRWKNINSYWANVRNEERVIRDVAYNKDREKRWKDYEEWSENYDNEHKLVPYENLANYSKEYKLAREKKNKAHKDWSKKYHDEWIEENYEPGRRKRYTEHRKKIIELYGEE